MRLDPIFLFAYDEIREAGGYSDRYSYLPMPRTLSLISIGVALVLVAGVWFASAQVAGPKKADAPEQTNSPKRLDINQASLDELKKLPGITPALAERIVKHRPYRKLDDLVTQKVLGKKQFARIRDLITIPPNNH